MPEALNEKPNAEALPTASSAGIVVDGRYVPPPEDKDGKIWVRTSALIQVDANTLYEMWRDIEKAPLWQESISQVTRTGESTSHWVMRQDRSDDAEDKGERNRTDKKKITTIEWDSEIVADERGRRIAWRSIGGESQNAGEVNFEAAPGGRGTMVTVLQEFGLGKLANAWESIVGRNPKQSVIENLRRFKALAETGEIPRIQGQSHGPRGAVAGVKKSMYGEKIATPQGTHRKAAKAKRVTQTSRVRNFFLSHKLELAMKAACWMGTSKVEVYNVPDPTILNPHDAVIKITRTAICGSDLHLYDGFIPTMEEGDILGHEFMGIVEEVGKDVTNLTRGDRVVVPFTIACGHCQFCKKKIWSACDNTNPGAHLMEGAYGYSGSGLFGYSHMMGGYAGGQAQYVRVPFANVGPLKIESDLPDEKVLFLSDIFPTGYMAAENAQIRENDIVAVWGCGPVGQFAIASAFMLGAARVIAIDRFPERLDLARSIGAITVDYSEEDVSVLTALKDLTGGIGPDSCIDAVGLEAHSTQLQGIYDVVKTALMLETDRPSVLRQAIQAVRKGGTVSIPGVYGGLLDKVPFGAAFGKGITMKMGQTNMHNYMKPLLERIEKGQIDPSYIISHRITLDEVPDMYKVWRDKKEHVTKIVIDPWAENRTGSASRDEARTVQSVTHWQ